MVRVALAAGWLVVLPGLVLWAIDPTVHVDTSRAAAARIRPGMTLSEVEGVIGAPPGIYLHGGDPRFTFTSGSRWPKTVNWSGPDGHVVVYDGEFGFAQTSGLRKPDGVVDSVHWYPLTGRDAPWESLGAHALLIYVLFFGVYAGYRSLRRREAGCPAAAGGG